MTVNGKGSRTRIVPISMELRKTLFRYLQAREKTLDGKPVEVVFCSRNGTALTYRNAYRDIKRVCKKAGVEGEHVHPHAFRHCFAVTYIRRGGNIYRLSRILGHSSTNTTEIYLRSIGVEQIAEGHSRLTPLAKTPATILT